MTIAQREDRDRYVITWTNRRTGQGFRREATGADAANAVVDLIRSDPDAKGALVTREYVAKTTYFVKWFDLAAQMRNGRGDCERQFDNADEARAFVDSLRSDRMASGITTPPPKSLVRTEKSYVLDATGRPI